MGVPTPPLKGSELPGRQRLLGWVPHQHPSSPPAAAESCHCQLPSSRPHRGLATHRLCPQEAALLPPSCSCGRTLPPAHTPRALNSLYLGAPRPLPPLLEASEGPEGPGVAPQLRPVPWAGLDLWVGEWGGSCEPSPAPAHRSCTSVTPICRNSSAVLPFPCIWPSWPPGTPPAPPCVTRTSPGPAPLLAQFLPPVTSTYHLHLRRERSLEADRMESRACPDCLSRGRWTWRGEGLAGVTEKGGRRHGVRAQASWVLSRLPQGPFHTPQSLSVAKFSPLVPVLPSPPSLPATHAILIPHPV